MLDRSSCAGPTPDLPLRDAGFVVRVRKVISFLKASPYSAWFTLVPPMVQVCPATQL